MPKSNDTFKDAVRIVALTNELEKAKQEISLLRNELEKLKSAPIVSSSVLSTDNTISDEEDIALRELRKLQNKSKTGQELTLEEVKKYDILVKNKRQVQDSEPQKNDDLPDSMDEDNLLKFANSKLEKK